MDAVLGCLINQHDPRLLVAAVGLCLLSCITARIMVLRAHALQTMRLRLPWLVGAGMVSGAGIWATHFVAMLAYLAPLPLAFDPVLTIVSIVIAIAVSAAGFTLSFTRAGGALGGMVVGCSILGMHYTGMAALRVPAITIWNSQMIAASILIGLSVGGLAGHFAVIRPTLRNSAITIFLRAAVILGVHFTGMAAFRLIPTGQVPAADPRALSVTAMAIMVISAAAFVVGQALVVTMVSRYLAARAQGEALRMRIYIAELEATQAALRKTSSDLTVALDAAQAASKSKSAFLASMSHELRTPLNAVIGFSEMMLSEIFGPLGSARYKEYAGNIQESGKHLLSLINDVLDISRTDAGHVELDEEEFDLSAKIANTMRMISAQAAKAHVNLAADVAPGLVLNGDKRRIRQILLNLLSNALKFTPAEGSVIVRAFRNADGVVLQVIDTGIGIAPQDFSRALEPFGQVDSSLARKYQGTGLGLPLTRQMAELHGGSLELASVPGKGTTVTVTFPAWRLTAPQAQTAAA